MLLSSVMQFTCRSVNVNVDRYVDRKVYVARDAAQDRFSLNSRPARPTFIGPLPPPLLVTVGHRLLSPSMFFHSL